jgi:glycosyltransferase involved in cell wall biosynthesis
VTPSHPARSSEPASAPSGRGLRVALNLVFLHERSGGVGGYARELVPALLTAEPGLRVTAFASRELPPEVRRADWAGELEWVTLPVRTSGGPPGSFALATAAQWLALPLEASRRRVDVIHGLANVAPLWSARAARVVTLLDLIWLHFPSSLEPAAAKGMRRVALPSVRRADRVIAISDAAREDMIATLGLSPERVDATPLGVSAIAAPVRAGGEAELRRRLGLGEERILATFSAGREHKNLPRLVRAFAAVRQGDCALVIAGDVSREERELRRLAAGEGVADRVRIPGWLSAEDREGLYASATCVVVASLMEGFGLPVLEAMARGVPVACSSVSGLGEVAGEAAELFDPASQEQIAAALERVLGDPARREELIRRGHERCSIYTWDRTARATLACYRRAIDDRRQSLSGDRGR